LLRFADAEVEGRLLGVEVILERAGGASLQAVSLYNRVERWDEVTLGHPMHVVFGLGVDHRLYLEPRSALDRDETVQCANYGRWQPSG
jgi:hypothetical protein